VPLDPWTEEDARAWWSVNQPATRTFVDHSTETGASRASATTTMIAKQPMP
jgi:hypothetical protein